MPERAEGAPATYVTSFPGVEVRSDLAVRWERLDAVIFDVDGVLLDTHGSYPQVIAEVVRHYLRQQFEWPDAPELVSAQDTEAFKLVGGFNSDWALARGATLYALWRTLRFGRDDWTADRSAGPAIAEFTARLPGPGLQAVHQLLASVGPDEVVREVESRYDGATIDRLCCEYYGGSDHCRAMFGFEPEAYRGPGLCNRERPRLDTRLIPPPLRVGVYTGRVAGGEVEFALDKAGLRERCLPAAVITGDRWRKPDPQGLREAARHLRPRLGLFVGDNLDDLWTVLNYQDERLGDGSDVARQAEDEHVAAGSDVARQAEDEQPPFLFAAVLGGAPGARAEELFKAQGADLVAREPDALLRFLAAAVAAEGR